jgi:hypothetical protein
VESTIKPHNRFAEVDFFIAYQQLIDLWNNEFVSCGLFALVVLNPIDGPYAATTLLYNHEVFCFATSSFNLCILFTIIFVSWKNGSVYWVKFAPTFYYVIIHMLYLIIPTF